MAAEHAKGTLSAGRRSEKPIDLPAKPKRPVDADGELQTCSHCWLLVIAAFCFTCKDLRRVIHKSNSDLGPINELGDGNIVLVAEGMYNLKVAIGAVHELESQKVPSVRRGSAAKFDGKSGGVVS
jgi:hypothetical protein